MNVLYLPMKVNDNKNIVKQNNMSRVKILVIIALYAIIMMPLQAQEWQTVSKFEFEMWGGLGVPLGGYHRGDSKTGASVGMSLRYNFSEIPVDCGVYVALNSARRDFKRYSGDGDYYQNNRTGSFGIEGNYNFGQGLKVNPFAGLCLGVGVNDVVGDRHVLSSGTTMSIMPRLGVELFHHLRVGAYCQLTRRGYNNAGLMIGIVVGGRPRK